MDSKDNDVIDPKDIKAFVKRSKQRFLRVFKEKNRELYLQTIDDFIQRFPG